jgi:carbamoyl-phosphate synthase large subunit
LETGLTGFDEIAIPGAPRPRRHHPRRCRRPRPTGCASSPRPCATAFRRRHPRATAFDPWFLARIREIIDAEAEVRRDGLPVTADGLRKLKMLGFTDARLAKLTGRDEGQVRRARRNLGVTAVFKRIDTCAAEFEAQTPYMYSTYEPPRWATWNARRAPRPQEGRHPGRRPQPDRPGDRVRLLLLPCLLCADRGGL